MGYADKDQLGKPRLLEEDFETLTGHVIRVRGLSRQETILLAAKGDQDYEARVIHMGMVQPDSLTLTDIKAWFKAAPSEELRQVRDRIFDLSGLGDDPRKAMHKSVPDGSGDSV